MRCCEVGLSRVVGWASRVVGSMSPRAIEPVRTRFGCGANETSKMDAVKTETGVSSNGAHYMDWARGSSG